MECILGIVKSYLPATGDYGFHHRLFYGPHKRGMRSVTKFSIQGTKANLNFSCKLQIFRVLKPEKKFCSKPWARVS